MTRRDGVTLHRWAEDFERSEMHFDRLAEKTGRRMPLRYSEAISYLRVLVLEGYRKPQLERALADQFPEVWAWLQQHNVRSATRPA